MRGALPLLVLFAACTRDPTLVVVDRLAPGGGGVGAVARPELDIVIHVEDDATDFEAADLMRVLVNGVDRTPDVVLGGNYAVLRISPAPLGSNFVELFRRTGPLLDTFTWNVSAYAGPTLGGVTPSSARAGAQVTMAGSGFDAGLLRVYFGGVEGTVDASDATSITASVPAGALPGLVFVLVGEEAAEGVVDFQPLDDLDMPVPQATGPRIFAVLPAAGGPESAVRFYGAGFDNTAAPSFNGAEGSRGVELRTETLPVVGDVVCAFAVVGLQTPPGPGLFSVSQTGTPSNPLPFTVN
ncbi:MAG: IPT/TIG domain-containing protein [Planctomycetota bacterium]